MANLNFEDLKKTSGEGMTLEDVGGVDVHFPPLMGLSADELKHIYKYVEILDKDSTDNMAKLDAIDACLVAACDQKDVLKKALKTLPMEARMAIFKEWMGGAEVGEASPSTSS